MNFHPGTGHEGPQRGADVQLYSFCDLGARWCCGRSTPRPGRITHPERPSTHCIGEGAGATRLVWTGKENLAPRRKSITGPSSLWRVAIPTTLSWSTLEHKTVMCVAHDSQKNQILVSVHSCQQKSIGLIFCKSQTGSDVRYSCHHNSSRSTFPIFAHSCRFSVLHSLQSITPRIY